jgi:hypothetical protein
MALISHLFNLLLRSEIQTGFERPKIVFSGEYCVSGAGTQCYNTSELVKRLIGA